MKKLFVYCTLITCIIGCSHKKKMKPVEYVHWIEDTDHYLHQVKQLGDIELDVQYRPADYILCKSGELEDVVSPDLLDSLRQKYDSLFFVSITLKGINGGDPLVGVAGPEQIEAVLYYFQFQFQKDIFLSLEKSGQKLSPVLFHFERFYTVNNAKTFLVGFDKNVKTLDQDVQLIIDSEYLPSGQVNFTFDKEELSDQPVVEL